MSYKRKRGARQRPQDYTADAARDRVHDPKAADGLLDALRTEAVIDFARWYARKHRDSGDTIDGWVDEYLRRRRR